MPSHPDRVRRSYDAPIDAKVQRLRNAVEAYGAAREAIGRLEAGIDLGPLLVETDESVERRRIIASINRMT